MKSTVRFLLAAVCLALGGCESTRHEVAASVKEKFTGPTYVRRVYAADLRSVFDVARANAERLGFRITRAGAAQGVLDGVSRLTSDDRLRGSRQQTIKVRLVATAEGGTELAVLFTEIIEDDFDKGAGQGIETSLRDHPLYASFFAGFSALPVR
ncbi:MAG: hypothetical protein H2172_16880 [Opitutus sp.]|nr:hypothetical protein [Opitutus sp.]MCS6246668.1 hypothetical protein [Opitutus sp.]MCS6272829.1 hypothetical protein [Opitutus sp.]MCS6278827.1 hypothetical protein [Opitutus sp.]MCS6299595.1 hypothetical protein [Opitutus sp.]